MEVTQVRSGDRVSVTIPQIHSLLNLPLQPVPCEQVHCHEVAGVWLKLITYTVKSQKEENNNLQVFMNIS